jgi:hypothetical protein
MTFLTIIGAGQVLKRVVSTIPIRFIFGNTESLNNNLVPIKFSVTN